MLPIISALASDAGASTDASQEPHQPEPAPLSALPNLLPRGHPWDVPFFLAISGLQYCRLAWALGMAALAATVCYAGLIMIAAFMEGRSVATALTTAPFWLLFQQLVRPYDLRQRQRAQLHRDLCALATEAGDYDLAGQPSLSACSLRDRWRYRAALLQGLRVAGLCRNSWDAFTHTCSLMAWNELAVPGLLAGWVLLSLTPEMLSGRVGWPFVDVAWWWWMQAAFAWRLKWSIFKQLVGTTCACFSIFPVLASWLSALYDIRATARARKAKVAARGGDEWMPPRPSHLSMYEHDSDSVARDKDRRYMALYLTLMQPPKLWERVGLPAPTWQQVVCLIAVVSGGLAYGGLTDVLAEPGTRLYTGLAWPRLALRYWRQQLRAGDPGTLGLTLIAAAAVICVAAMLTSSARKCWYNTYMDTLAREMVMSGAMRPTRSCEAVASSVATAVHGDCPSTFVRLLDWGFQLFRFYLGMCGGALLVGWLLFGGSVPAYGLPSFRGYTGYSGQWIVRPPPPICLALLNVSGSNNSSVGGAYTPAEAVLDGVTYALTPQLVAAVKEVADLGGGFGGWWQRLQLASRINLLAVRTFRSRGLDGVQAALEALRAARELSPFIISGQATNEYEEVYAQAVSVLQGYPLHHGLTEEDYARHTDVKWYIGSSIWSLGLACEKLYVRPLHFPRSSSVIAAGASSGGGMRSEVRGGNRAMGGALTGLTEADLLIDAGPTHAAPSAPPPPMCDARSVLDRALTGAWHCTAALGQSTSRSPATSAASRASQRRATADNTKPTAQAGSASSPKKKRKAPAAASAAAGGGAGGWLAFLVALAVVYLWVFVWPPWTRSPELFVNHVAGLFTRGGREARTSTRKPCRSAAAAGSSGGGSGRKEEAVPVAPSSKGLRQQPQKQKQAKQPQMAANGAAAERAAPSREPTRNAPPSLPPSELAELERAASSSSAQSGAASAAPTSVPRSTSQGSSKQGSKTKPKVPAQAKPAPAKQAAAPGPAAAAAATNADAPLAAAVPKAAAGKPPGTAPSLADHLPFTAILAANAPERPEAESDHLARVVDEAIAAQHATAPPPTAASPQPKRGERSSAAAAAVGDNPRSYAHATASDGKRSAAPQPAAAAHAAAAVPSPPPPASRPTVTTSALFSWNRPVIITTAPPPPLTAAQLRAQAQQAPSHTVRPAAATGAAAPASVRATDAAAPAPAFAAQLVGATAAKQVAVPIPVPIPVPEPMPGGLPPSQAASAPPASGASGPAAAAGAGTAASAAVPLPRAPPSAFMGFNPALAHVLGRAYSSAAAPAPTAPSAAADAAACSAAAARAPGSFHLYDTTGLDAAKCIRCRGGMREIVYLHNNNTVAHRAFCRACSAADGRAVGEPCPLCNQPVERVLSMY
ncbi:hypothetical protein CHLRE_12g530250v5 [Chlamydomonas reinhardtii]|uniref:Uncharacterized protein n=1 Tax=Chlamydomonas reinhardtii TaxID=3055 RepID=A0A2K3D4Q7_CHLRE|nr:uncharacterized protein CHLRE_12g530250v5 [Chlamydomonas reinhardtii]PNW75526.1 hypothetical protein CHLRE_12g530250v5 [Chlamydomonas reinhardtii]